MRLLSRPLRMPPRILGGHPKNREIIKILTKIKNISNHNSHWICYLSNKLPTSAIMRLLSRPLRMPPWILVGHPKNREIIKILTKIKHISNHNSHWTCYLSNKLPTSVIMRLLLRPLSDAT
jgi:hypothetical protein